MYVNFDISWHPVVTARNDVNCSRFVPGVVHDEVTPFVISSFSDNTCVQVNSVCRNRVMLFSLLYCTN